MLKVIEYGKDEYEFPALIVLGCFDAIHIGHRELLKKAKLQAKINGLDLGVMMFKDGKSGKLLSSLEERLAILEEYNVKFILAIDYNDDFKKIVPLAFLNEVEDKINVKAYMSGKDFRFGAGAKGKASTLKSYADNDENGVWYMNIKDVDLDGEKVSTTLIKSCLDGGDVAKACRLLGREYSVTGEVVKGAGRGATVVGFPTVNIDYPEWKYPVKYGVYNVNCTIDGTVYQGVANFGTCPTFGDERISLEVYLEGYDGDLYGQILTINFVLFIRDIEQFASAEELSAQVRTDIETTSDETAVAEDSATEEVAAQEPVATAPVEEVATEEVAIEEVVEEQPVEEPIVEEIVEEQPAEEAVVEEVVEKQPVEEAIIEEVIEEHPVEETLVDEVVEVPVQETVVEETAVVDDNQNEDVEQSENEEAETVSGDDSVGYKSETQDGENKGD